MSRVVVCCGAGGVGKTTLASAIALRFAIDGQRVVVLTIDPARRLADSLGIPLLGNEPCPVNLEGSVPPSHGSLHAFMLDPRTTFDQLIARLVSDPSARKRILENRYYKFISTRLSGSHEYMAMERLDELVRDERFDVVVLDTPPSAHALDFLTAPDRVLGVMDRSVLHILAMPHTRVGLKVLRQGSAVVVSVLERFLGGHTLRDIADFVSAFEGFTEPFAARAMHLGQILRSETATFLLVTTTSNAAVDETLTFLHSIEELGFPFRGVLVNRFLAFPQEPAPVLPGIGEDPDLEALKQAATLLFRLAGDDRVRLARLEAGLPPNAGLWTVPSLGEEAHDLDALARISAFLPGFYDVTNAGGGQAMS
jgi:anion-transporting  ArsA/GET3 family ATPase